MDCEIDFDDFFLRLGTLNILDDAAVFDSFFEMPFDQIAEESQGARIDLFIDAFTFI